MTHDRLLLATVVLKNVWTYMRILSRLAENTKRDLEDKQQI